jgi:hypothetical protein
MTSVSANYPSPVQVNGFTCRNCTDVDYAKKHIDPAHPKAGPYGINAASDPSLANKPVVFGGALSSLNGQSQAAGPAPAADAGANLDISA